MPSTIPLSIQNQLLVLPELHVSYNGQTLLITDGVLDTGSAGTLVDVNLVEQIGITTRTGIDIHQVFGVAGSEFVFTHEVTLTVGNTRVSPFVVEVGNTGTYGTRALIGLDFLMAIGALLDLKAITLTLPDP
jgi:hypothetical protein